MKNMVCFFHSTLLWSILKIFTHKSGLETASLTILGSINMPLSHASRNKPSLNMQTDRRWLVTALFEEHVIGRPTLTLLWHQTIELPRAMGQGQLQLFSSRWDDKDIFWTKKSSKCSREELNGKKNTPWFSLISSKNILKTKNTWFGWRGTLILTPLALKVIQVLIQCVHFRAVCGVQTAGEDELSTLSQGYLY